MWAFLFGLTLLSFVPSWARRFAWHDFLPDWPIGLSFISFFLPRGFMAYLLLSCFVPLIVLVGLLAAISCLDGSLCFISFFLSSSGFYGTLFLFCFAFISYCACGPAYCHFLPCWFTGLYLFLSSLGFYGQFISICFSILLFFIFCLLLGLSAIGPFLTKIGINTHLPHFSRNSYN